MRIRVAIPDEHVTPEVIDPILETVTRLDEHLIRSGQSPTSHELVSAGAVWRPENMGDEHFDHGATISQRGWGDCDDWAPIHAATLRATGEDPGARAIVLPSGPTTFHAMVQRGDGRIETGDEDISVRAGMKPLKGMPSVIGAADCIEVQALDPHDGRLYQGCLAPAVGPLAPRAGLQSVVRGCHVIGGGSLYEARVDVPIAGSALIPVRGYVRHRRIHGATPLALSVTHMAATPDEALYGAVVGAVLCGDAAELTTSADRYKLLAVQSAMAGSSPGQVRDQLIAQMQADILAHAEATGTDPREHSTRLLRELAQQGHIDGYCAGVIGGVIVGSLFGDIWHAASGVVSSVTNVVKDVAKDIGPWTGTIVHGLEAITSMVPGVGTVVSDVLAAAETAVDTISALASGHPLEAGIKAAYNFALSSVPAAAALRFVLDPVVNTLLELADHKEPVETALLNHVLDVVPAEPSFGPISPRSVAQTLAHLIVSHLGVKQSPPGAPVSRPPPIDPSRAVIPGKPIWIDALIQNAAHAAAAAKPRKLVRLRTRPAVQAAKMQIPPPRYSMRLPSGPRVLAPTPHAAVPASPESPPHPTALPAPALAPTPPAPNKVWVCNPLPNGGHACAWQ